MINTAPLGLQSRGLLTSVPLDGICHSHRGGGGGGGDRQTIWNNL